MRDILKAAGFILGVGAMTVGAIVIKQESVKQDVKKELESHLDLIRNSGAI